MSVQEPIGGTCRVVELANNRERRERVLYAFVACYVFTHIMLNSTLLFSWPQLEAYCSINLLECLVFAFCLLAYMTARDRLNSIQSVLLLGIAPVLFAIARTNGDAGLALTFAMLPVLALGNARRVCRAYSLGAIVAILLLIVLTITGVIYGRDVIPNDRIVFAYGTGGPNVFGGILFSALGALMFALWDDDTHWIASLLAGVAAVFAKVALSSSGTCVLCAALCIIGLALHSPLASYLPKLSRGAYFGILVLVPATLMALTLFLTVCYNAENPAMAFFNRLIHSRPHYAHQYYVAYGGFTLLGRVFIFSQEAKSGQPFASVDSGYSFLALVYGLASLVACSTVYVHAAWRYAADTERHPLVLPVIVLGAFYLLIEGLSLWIYTSWLPILVAEAFRRNPCPPNAESTSS